MGLRTKFNLVLGLCTLVGMVAAGWFAHTMLQKNARQEIEQAATLMMESAMAVRSYTVNEIKPLLAVQQRRQFLPQTVPAYAATRFVGELQKEHPEYAYKEAALNPTNPADRAADWEADIIQYFRNNESETQLIGERDTPAGRSLFMSRPIQIKDEKCLACHSVPSAAPQTFLDTYGTANGFGWQLNEIIGAQIVSVPMDVPMARAEKAFVSFMGAILAVFAGVFLITNLLLHRIVIKPVSQLSARADQVSMGDLEIEELEVKGNDEIASLSRSLNRMHRSLSNAVTMLDEMDEEEQSMEMDRAV